MSNLNKAKNYWILTPIMGISIFISLYIIATFLYPGGSNADSTEKGFNWFTNYWCDLSATVAKNGETNAARPVAMAAMMVLCISLSVFWLYIPQLFNFRKRGKRVIQYSGIASMASIIWLLFSTYHDTVINIAAILGSIALIYTFVGLYRAGYRRVFNFGLFCLLLIGLNNFIYYSHTLILYLPVIQKITFIIFLSWVSLLTIRVYSKAKMS